MSAPEEFVGMSRRLVDLNLNFNNDYEECRISVGFSFRPVSLQR